MLQKTANYVAVVLIFLVLCTISEFFLFYNKRIAVVFSHVMKNARNGSSGVVEDSLILHSHLHHQNQMTGLFAPAERNVDGVNRSDILLSHATMPINTVKEEMRKTKITEHFTSKIQYAQLIDGIVDVASYNKILKINMENEKGCQNASSYDAIMGVLSEPGNVLKREAFRWMYADFSKSSPYKIKVWFFIGKISNSTIQSELVSEYKKYGDIVQGNFIDSNRNLPYKAIFAFKWLNERCAGFRRLVRLNDDALLRISHLFNVWNTRVKKEENIIMCDVMSDERVQRENKWALEKLENPEYIYNSQCCLGYFVALTPELVPKIEAASRKTRFVWNDYFFKHGFVARKIGATSKKVASNIDRYDEKAFVTCLTNEQCNALALISSPEKLRIFTP